MTTALVSQQPGRFFDLGFRGPDDPAPDRRADLPRPAGSERPPLMLGKRKSTLMWEIAAWLAAAAGIFARQGLKLPSLQWTVANVSIGAGVASVVIGLAMFPMMMRWINRRRRRASLEHVAAPFAFGFFLDLAIVAAIKIPTAILSFA